MWENLLFFNKFGDNLQFEYDSSNDIWRGNIYLPLVSTFIYEQETIHILERLYDNINSQDMYRLLFIDESRN